jgi:hypothetical protein
MSIYQRFIGHPVPMQVLSMLATVWRGGRASGAMPFMVNASLTVTLTFQPNLTLA